MQPQGDGEEKAKLDRSASHTVQDEVAKREERSRHVEAKEAGNSCWDEKNRN